MSKAYRNCQSCGMPMKRDAKGGGTNNDGSKSEAYCSHCYENGEFTQPNLTAKEMQSRVQQKLRESGMPGILTGLFTLGIPRLVRWRHSGWRPAHR